jgi:peptide/nickel transport system substrate-binding protein
VHFINDVPTADVARLEENDSLSILRIEQPGHGWSLMFNFDNYPSNQLAVRQAMAYAIDKQAMVDIVFNGFGTPGCSPLTKVMFAYIDVQCADYPYDPMKAGEILDADGWVDTDGDGIRDKDGEPLWLEHWTLATVPAFAGMSTVIESYAAEVGIKFNLNLATRAGYFDAVRAGEHHTQHWWDTGLDPDTVMRTLYHSSNADGGTNRNRYRDEEMDALILAGSSTAVTEEREAIYHQLQQKIADEVIMLFMVDPFLLYGSATNLQGMTYLAGGNVSNFIGASFSDE